MNSVRSALEIHGLVAAALLAGAAVLVLAGPHRFAQDGWLALVVGRRIVESGLPHVDDLTLWGAGATWIDQQWLAHLLMYGEHKLGGLPLVMGASVLAAWSGAVLATLAARSLGGAARHVTLVLVPALALAVIYMAPARTQSYAFPLFVAVLWLLLSPLAARRRRTLLVLPLLVLWANVHGSVLVGVMLSAVFGVVALVQARVGGGDERGASSLVPLALVVGSPLALLATPYGLDIIDYYRATLVDRDFGDLVSEWQPPFHSTVIALPLMALGISGSWVLGRSGARTPPFSVAAFALLFAGACFATRTVPWFALTALMVLPAAITRTFGATEQPRRARVNVLLAAGGLALLVGAVVATGVRGDAPFDDEFPPEAAAIVGATAAADPALHVFATDRYADWLLWERPELAGRMVFDIRFEVLPEFRLAQLSLLGGRYASRLQSELDGAGIAVLEADGYAELTRSLAGARGASVPFRRGDLVLVRPAQR